MPFISKIERQSDYHLFPSTTPIVIDNGASYFRIGWVSLTVLYHSHLGFSVFLFFFLIIEKKKCFNVCLWIFVDGLERLSLVLFSVTLFRGHAIKLLVPMFFFVYLVFVWFLRKWQKVKKTGPLLAWWISMSSNKLILNWDFWLFFFFFWVLRFCLASENVAEKKVKIEPFLAFYSHHKNWIEGSSLAMKNWF